MFGKEANMRNMLFFVEDRLQKSIFKAVECCVWIIFRDGWIHATIINSFVQVRGGPFYITCSLSWSHFEKELGFPKP